MDFRNRLKDSKRVVVKVGTTSLTHKNGKIDLRKLERLAVVLTDLNNRGIDVVLVSSGAIAVGADKLGLESRPRDTIGKQVASAVGQAILMQMYEKFFGEYNQKIAQILLTMAVFNAQHKTKNVQNTINSLLKMRVIPIVNENDSVATEEFNEFSDNDTLSAYVASIINSDLLIILSDIEGLFTADPNKDKSATIINVVENVNDSIYQLASGSSSKLGTGGMLTKVKAADLLTKKGINMVIASGSEPEILYDIVEGRNVGTLFLGK